MIDFNDFLKVDMRVGKILQVEEFPEARKPAYKLLIDFGSETGQKKSSAQITENYGKEELIDKLVIAVVNFPPKQIANFISEVLVLGVPDKNGNVILIEPNNAASPGAKVY